MGINIFYLSTCSYKTNDKYIYIWRNNQRKLIYVPISMFNYHPNKYDILTVKSNQFR